MNYYSKNFLNYLARERLLLTKPTCKRLNDKFGTITINIVYSFICRLLIAITDIHK